MDEDEVAPSTSNKIRLGPIGQFAVKALVAAAMVVVSSDIVMEMASAKLEGILRKNIEVVRADVQSVKNVGMTRVLNRLVLELEQAAGPNAEISPERKQKILSDMRIVADRLQPFIAEASAIVAGAMGAAPTAAKK